MGKAVRSFAGCLAVLLLLCLSAAPAQAVVTAGNGFYTVHVQNTGTSIGTFTVTTGPNHPAGPGKNVLAGNGSPGSSFTTVRSYQGQQGSFDYVNSPGKTTSPPFQVRNIGQCGVVTAVTATHVRTFYDTSCVFQLNLEITQDVRVNGTTFASSTVSVTTTVNSFTESDEKVGIRYLWDLAVDDDGGPTFQPLSPDGSVRTEEAEFGAPGFERYGVADNEVEPVPFGQQPPPTYRVLGTAKGPAPSGPAATPAEILRYACQPTAFPTAFSYSVAGREVASSSSECQTSDGGDSSALTYWGATESSALVAPFCFDPQQPCNGASATATLWSEETTPPPPPPDEPGRSPPNAPPPPRTPPAPPEPPDRCGPDSRVPRIRISSDQRTHSYRLNQFGSVTTKAADGHGLRVDPSGNRRISTNRAGSFTISRVAVDECGNRATKRFRYRVVPPPRASVRHRPAPGGCPPSFVSEVRISSPVALQRAQLFVDGRLLRTTRSKRFLTAIRTRSLSNGVHRMTIVAVDAVGNRRSSSRQFGIFCS